MTRRVWLMYLLTASLVADATFAQFPRDRQSVLALVEGYVGEKTPDPLPLTSWVLNDRGRLQRFQVLRISVLLGNVSYDNIVTIMEPYAYDDALTTFFLRGPATLLDQFAATPKHQRITLIGYMRLPQRQWNLSQVAVMEAATPTPTP